MTLLGEAVAAAKKFEEDHGGKPIRDPDGSEEVFPDGTARRHSEVMNGYEIREPMTPADKIRGRYKYVSLLLQMEEREFTNFKKDCIESVNYSGYYINRPTPPANAKELLEAGAERIAALRDELAALDRELSQFPEERARRAFLEEQTRKAHANRNLANELMGIQY